MKFAVVTLSNFLFTVSCYYTFKCNWTIKNTIQRPIDIRNYLSSYPNDSDLYDSVDATREAILTIIEQSWFKVCLLIPQAALNVCEDELRDATSLLVLASIRRSALTNAVSRKTIERMLEEADEDQDGQVTFVEWFDWLSHSAHNAARPRIEVGSKSKMNINDNKKRLENDIDFSDPMIESLGRVLSHAVCTVKVASRIQNDPFFLSAAFVAGGIQSGVLDKDVCRAMLSRLSRQTRDLVTQALSVESGSMAPRLSQVSQLSLAASISPTSPTGPTIFPTSSSSSSSSFLPSLSSTITNPPNPSDTYINTNTNIATSKTTITTSVTSSASSEATSSTSATANNLFFDQLCAYDNTANSGSTGSSIKKNSVWSASSFPTALTQAVMSMNNQDIKSMEAATVDIMTRSYNNNNNNIDNIPYQSSELSQGITTIMADKPPSSLPTFVTTENKKRNKFKKKTSIPRNVVISTIDLASVPVLTAPAVNDINTVSAANSIRLARLALASLAKTSNANNTTTNNNSSSIINNSNNKSSSSIINNNNNSNVVNSNSNIINNISTMNSVHVTSSSTNTMNNNNINAISGDTLRKSSFDVPKYDTHDSVVLREYIDRASHYNDDDSDDSDEEEVDDDDEEEEEDEEEADKVELSVIYHTVNNDNNNENIMSNDAVLVSAVTNTNTNDFEKKAIVSSSALLLSSSDDNTVKSAIFATNTADTMKLSSPSLAMTVTTQPSRVDTAEEMYAAASRTLEDMQQARISLTDFDDKNSAMVRKMIVSKVGERKDVMGLALALRAARLQHAGTLQNTAKHRVAVETLQIWAPLSFQLGMSSQVPELEVHSYVLLFPQSFNSFIGWFDHFRPLAKKVLRKFRGHLKQLLESDPVLPSLATKITLQSRIKAPSSAFKKMVRSSKGRQDLHDMLGLRVIITENLPPSPISYSSSSSSSLSSMTALSKYQPPPPPDLFPRKKNNTTINNRIHDDDSDKDRGIGMVIEGEFLSKVWSTTDDLSVTTAAITNTTSTTTTTSSFTSTLAESNENNNDTNDDGYDDGYDEEEEEEEEEEAREDAVWRAHDIIHACCCFDPMTKDERTTPINTDNSKVSTTRSASGYFGRSNDERSGSSASGTANRLIENEWCEDPNRFKDYVKNPKPSGYQSLHMVLIHQATGINLEIQIRSERMHFIAEYGPASHRNYKALVLPTTATVSNTNNSTSSSTQP